MRPTTHARGQSEPESMDMALISALSAPWDFLRPTKKLRTGILDTAKIFMDSLAASVSDSQTTRQRNQRKRKRSEEDQDAISILRLKQLYVDGFTSDQIWEQSLRIFDSADQEIERDYSFWAENIRQPVAKLPESLAHLDRSSQHDDGSEDDSSISDSEGIMDEFSDDDEQAGQEPKSEAEELSQSDLEPSDSEGGLLDDNSVYDNGHEDETYIEDRFGLNDGFFSIDDFNKQTQIFEQQDARGDLDDESDEDEVDWHADPSAAGGMNFPSQKNADRVDDDMSESDEEEEGPTFDNISTLDESDIEEDDSHAAALGGTGFSNTSDIKYADFFAPPPRKASKKRSRPLPKTQPSETISGNDVDRAMADVRRDLFDDEASAHGDDNEPGNPDDRVNRSTHEKQRARIADEIRRLEAANVAKKEWMLAGEARAVERPNNSLIEENLDFERIGKPVPVVTAELSESIEDLIKRRIVAKEFDEVIRRRLGLSDRQNTQKARAELDDSKPQHSLAELYETDHLRATDSNYVDPKNQKLLKEHTEITNLWREISSQLDTLSNWHYKPKAPQVSINVVTDAATITMEDAQPTASGAVRASATLAPQEIYAAAETTRANGEVMMKSGVPVTKEEMTREEKAKLRRRQKKQNQASAEPSKQRSGKAAEKQQIVSDLKKGGVKLIGKEGDVTDINGSKVAGVGDRDRNGAHAMKL
ncbi:U3 small nucleolar ribonucleoprotein complex, subunit Mpp10 [Aspergillus cavernicola]|uniref:U3 small nucleolar ribonucleoprotein protein MPP10 n=1 Tax=Aspergillus cavernicola TaxID=176166 RepID=A0ABR4HWS8_9EURO